MVNLTIPYRNPVPAAATMWWEVQARWPDCAENKGFVAGSGPTTWNISSHNADADGFAHALDIGVDIEGDGTGIPIQDAIDLSEHLRAIGYKEWKSGRAGRLAYIIHRGQIAGDHTGWAWVAYTGTSPHYDHIHVSFSYDYFWGDPVWELTSDVHSTAPWGIATITTGLASGITPFKEDTLSAAEVDKVMKGLADMEAGLRQNIKDHFLGGTTSADGWRPGATKIVIENQRRLNKANAQIAALGEAVKQLAKGQGVVIDYDRIDAGVKAALADGIEVTGTFAAKGADE